MTSTAKQRNTELGRIHQGAAALGLIREGDDSAYRDMLFAVGRVRSAAQLDQYGRTEVIKHLQACGWKPAPFARKGASKQPGHVRFIRMLWIKLFQAGHITDGSERALCAWVKHQSAQYHPDGVGWDAPQLMPKDAAARVTEQLKQWAKRCEVEW